MTLQPHTGLPKVRSLHMRADRFAHAFSGALAALAVGALVAVIATVAVQAAPVVSEVGLREFLLGQEWMPIDFGFGASYGIANFIAATMVVSALALAMAFVVSLGSALFLSCAANAAVRGALRSAIDLLAGIPSVVFGFVGLEVVSKAFISAGVPSGNCVLAASIVLAIDLAAAGVQKALSQRVSRRRVGMWALGRAGAVCVRAWAWASMGLACAVIAFLFGYVFVQGAGCISWEFITQSPSGAVLGSEGGIFPAIVGSAWFTGVALVLAVPLSVGTAAYRAFFCKNGRVSALVGRVISVIAGAPSIVLGLFAYAVLVRDAGLGRCVLAGGVALAIMIVPFIEVRVEKAFREVPRALLAQAASLGCSKSYVLRTLVAPYCRGEVLGAIVLGALYALGAAAPLIFTGGVAFAPLPTDVLSPAMALPLHLYLMLAQGTTIPQVYATAFVLMALVLVCNLAVSLYAYIRKKRWMKS